MLGKATEEKRLDEPPATMLPLAPRVHDEEARKAILDALCLIQGASGKLRKLLNR